MLQITERFVGFTQSALFTWTNFIHCRLKLASFGNLCIVFVQITTKLNYTAFYHYEDVTLFRKNPCKHELISQRVQERPLASGNQWSARDAICKIAQFKMADVKNFEAIFQRRNWLKWTKDPQIWYMSCMY